MTLTIFTLKNQCYLKQINLKLRNTTPFAHNLTLYNNNKTEDEYRTDTLLYRIYFLKHLKMYTFLFITVSFPLEKCKHYLSWHTIQKQGKNNEVLKLYRRINSFQVTYQTTFSSPRLVAVFHSLVTLGQKKGDIFRDYDLNIKKNVKSTCIQFLPFLIQKKVLMYNIDADFTLLTLYTRHYMYILVIT